MKLSRVFPLAILFAVPAVHAQMNPIFSALQSVQSAITQTRQLLPPTAGSGAQGSQPVMNEQETQMYNARKAADAQARQQAQDDSERITAADQAQYQAQRQRAQAAAKRASDEDDAEALAVENASIRRDAERQQRATAEAQSMPPLCPGLDIHKLGIGGFFVACKNKGATEPQMLARLGALPMMQQALYTDIIQDIYENNVTDIKKGNAIAAYDTRCTAQNNCQRIAW
ncbi:hypothetical protein B0G76_8344 [Paraburkholderia sp. BL23I1N1]|uniref:hypothetical protein n=1 Tax=Paraburkholderia sp. BL23I1N1 TaxID=1938802 RepID=UPI000E730E69|nr:hypothetical protein [Paraburkholderia sp. BL23I1N1]RKE24456.1 hypothetical protein B0G76_8344 [Paraburkholderia sp. BL23I1N1]